DEPCSREELRACLHDVTRLNRWFLGWRPLFQWLNEIVSASGARPIHILDVGCGNGDALRRVQQWAARRHLPVEFTGVDINPDAVAIAASLSTSGSHIHWVASDIFAYTPSKPVDLIISTIFTHHLSDPDVIRFLRWMEQNAALGWFINDLS